MTGSECNTAIPNIRFGALLTLCYCISWFGWMIQWNNVRIGAHHILFEWVKQTLRWLNELLFLILNLLFIVCAIRYQQNRSTVGALCWHFWKTFQQPPLKQQGKKLVTIFQIISIWFYICLFHLLNRFYNNDGFSLKILGIFCLFVCLLAFEFNGKCFGFATACNSSTHKISTSPTSERSSDMHWRQDVKITNLNYLPAMNLDKKSAGFGSWVSFQYRIMWVGCFHFSTVSWSSIFPFITNISTILISSIFLCFRNSSRNFSRHCPTFFGMLFDSTGKW